MGLMTLRKLKKQILNHKRKKIVQAWREAGTSRWTGGWTKVKTWNLIYKFNIQYRVWAETTDSGHHSCVDSPPRGKYIKSQGRKDTKSPPSTLPRFQWPQFEIVLTPGKTAQLAMFYIHSADQRPGGQYPKLWRSLVGLFVLSELWYILTENLPQTNPQLFPSGE